MKVKCLIVEDEPIAQEILKSYIVKTDFLEVMEQLGNAVQALTYLQDHTVDLLFLDIKMPQMTGIEFLKTLSVKPKVIITSAYRYYATDAFELDVADYLLKPYSFDRFLKAVGKVMNENAETSGAALPLSRERAYLFVKGNKQLYKIYIDEIIFLESQRDYVKLTLANQEIITRQTIAYYEQLLPANLFLRIHRSYIVSLDKISAVEANRLFLGDFPLPIGRNYKQHVHDVLKGIASEK